MDAFEMSKAYNSRPELNAIWDLPPNLGEPAVIFTPEGLNDLFHIGDQMIPAGIGPEFDPFVLHKPP
jgi:hypothetical protein